VLIREQKVVERPVSEQIPQHLHLILLDILLKPEQVWVDGTFQNRYVDRTWRVGLHSYVALSQAFENRNHIRALRDGPVRTEELLDLTGW